MIYAKFGLQISLGFLLLSNALAQQSAPAGSMAAPVDDRRTAIRGCLQGERGNYILISDTGMVYVLKNVGNKLDAQLNHEVEAKGKLLPGTVKTGTRSEKTGSSPSDVVHGVDGVPLQVQNLPADVRTLSKHCQAGDRQ